MASQPWQPGDAELERALADLSARLDYPTAPRLAESVSARLLAQPTRPATGPRGVVRAVTRRLAVAVLALVVLAGAVLTASPGTRTVVAQWLYLRGVTIFYTPTLPALAPRGRRLGLGQGVTLPQALARVPYRLLMPSALGAPDEVYVAKSPDGARVALVYRARRGLPRATTTGVGALLIESPANSSSPFIRKAYAIGTQVSFVTVNGQMGVWLSGRPHLFTYMVFAHNSYVFRTEQARLAGNVLLWGQKGLIMRLEAQIPLAEALRIASSIR